MKEPDSKIFAPVSDAFCIAAELPHVESSLCLLSSIICAVGSEPPRRPMSRTECWKPSTRNSRSSITPTVSSASQRPRRKMPRRSSCDCRKHTRWCPLPGPRGSTRTNSDRLVPPCFSSCQHWRYSGYQFTNTFSVLLFYKLIFILWLWIVWMALVCAWNVCDFFYGLGSYDDLLLILSIVHIFYIFIASLLMLHSVVLVYYCHVIPEYIIVFYSRVYC